MKGEETKEELLPSLLTSTLSLRPTIADPSPTRVDCETQDIPPPMSEIIEARPGLLRSSMDGSEQSRKYCMRTT